MASPRRKAPDPSRGPFVRREPDPTLESVFSRNLSASSTPSRRLGERSVAVRAPTTARPQSSRAADLVASINANYFEGPRFDMSYAYARLDVNARRAEKQASREADIARRQAGAVSAQELQQENGFFNKLDMSQVKIVNRRPRAIKLG